MKIPKNLEAVRDELSKKYGRDSTEEVDFEQGFDAGVLSVFQSEEFKEIIEALKYYDALDVKIGADSLHMIAEDALYAYQKWVGNE